MVLHPPITDASEEALGKIRLRKESREVLAMALPEMLKQLKKRGPLSTSDLAAYVTLKYVTLKYRPYAAELDEGFIHKISNASVIRLLRKSGKAVMSLYRCQIWAKGVWRLRGDKRNWRGDHFLHGQ